MGGDLAPNLGGANKIFRGPISGKISIFRVKISDDLFLVIDLVLQIFPFFSDIFRMFTVLNVVYDHFLTRKTQFFTLFMLSRISDNTTSQNIVGPMHGRSPPPKILGGPSPPVPPRSPPLLLTHTITIYGIYVNKCIRACMSVGLYTQCTHT